MHANRPIEFTMALRRRLLSAGLLSCAQMTATNPTMKGAATPVSARQEKAVYTTSRAPRKRDLDEFDFPATKRDFTMSSRPPDRQWRCAAGALKWSEEKKTKPPLCGTRAVGAEITSTATVNYINIFKKIGGSFLETSYFEVGICFERAQSPFCDVVAAPDRPAFPWKQFPSVVLLSAKFR